MPSLIHSRLVLGLLALGVLPTASARDVMPSEVTSLLVITPKVYVTSFAKLPRSVVDALNTVTIGPREPMADAWAAWNPTDVSIGPPLPMQRLIWAAAVNGYAVIHYEQGGIGHSYQVVIISPPHIDGTRSVIWPTAVGERLSDFPAFAALARIGKAYTYNPRSR
jgi:hypothetical protein